ncbi:MAG: 50S ribosomal protein L21 [Actinomycetota bacterium]|nr:50S ribosomal protein L21 [Actinomycetota bacterium]
MSYAIISLGGKQYRVREGERLLVDRLPDEEGETFSPQVLLVGGDGESRLQPEGTTVTVRVVRHVLGKKIRIGKYRPKNGYRRHLGHRSRLSQIEIESIGTGRATARKTDRTRDAEPKEAATTPSGDVPEGYEKMTIAQLAEASASWDLPALEAALAYERAHSDRKGAVTTLESAIARKREEG